MAIIPEKMTTKYNPLIIEPQMLAYWKENKIYEKAKQKNSGRKRFYFLDGPPYTSGKIHLGTAWNKPLKDMVLRYKRMQGFDVWDRAGYDMHGLPVELKVEEKLGIKFKEEIPAFGVAKFVEECRNFALSNLKIMNDDFLRLGVWMDFENPYMSITSEFIEGEWWLIKKAYENNRLYEGEKVMHWCSHCATSLAKHELEYENVEDNSIFVKFLIDGTQDQYLVVWTTTPWTIPFNLGVMVHPDFDYIKARVMPAEDNPSAKEETWVVAKALAAVLISGVAGCKFATLEEFKGEKLKGTRYLHPFSDTVYYEGLRSKSPNIHTVVLSDEYVDLSAGSGLVHMAPGCGPEDYEVGRHNNIAPFNTLDEYGKYPEYMGDLAGLAAKEDDAKFIKLLDERGAIIATTKVSHEYAHCWRCKNPVIFRVTRQWFFKVEDLKEKMRQENKRIRWVPNWAGSRHFDSWLDNLRDNGITRQRYWGSPIPIWKCEGCGSFDVIGEIKELEQKAGKDKIPADLHKPWIDEVTYKCDCGATKKRIPDIADVWVDAGTTSWNCLDFPRRKDLFEQMFPADFILEGKDQIRGWFNLLLVASMVSMNKPSFKAVYMHGFVNDALGRKMSKSLGNIISPYEVIDKQGADTFRYYAIGGANPGMDLNYNFDDLKVKRRNLEVLWNLHNYLLDMGSQMELPKFEDIKDSISTEERYILSRLNSTIGNVTALYDEYRLSEIPWQIERLFLDLSRTYIQLVREKSSVGDDAEKKCVFWTAYNVFMKSVTMFATVAPFICESIHLSMKQRFELSEESIHLAPWPIPDASLIDEALEQNVEVAQGIIATILSLREKSQYGVRWPLSEVIVMTGNEEVAVAVERLAQIIKTQCNVKSIRTAPEFDKVKKSVKVEYAKLGPIFGPLAPKVIARLSQESASAIESHLEKDGKHTINLDGQAVEIPKEAFIFERVVEKPYVECEYRGSFVYLNTQMTQELESEGYAREIMRRVQSARKTAGLQKQHRIELAIQCDPIAARMLLKWQDAIKEKVGAVSVEILERKPEKEYSTKEMAKIKEKEFVVWFDKV